MNSEEQGRKMGEIVARAWSDETFKQQLISDPLTVLKENGIEVPPGVEVRILENTDKLFNFILPPKPVSGKLSDEQLDGVAGGFINCLDLARVMCPCDIPPRTMGCIHDTSTQVICALEMS